MLHQVTDADVRVLTLDRPPLNAIDLDLVEQMTRAFATVKAPFRRETRTRIETSRGQRDPLLETLGLG